MFSPPLTGSRSRVDTGLEVTRAPATIASGGGGAFGLSPKGVLEVAGRIRGGGGGGERKRKKLQLFLEKDFRIGRGGEKARGRNSEELTEEGGERESEEEGRRGWWWTGGDYQCFVTSPYSEREGKGAKNTIVQRKRTPTRI